MSPMRSGTARGGGAVAAGRAFLRAALVARRATGGRCVLLLPAPAARAGGPGPAGQPPSVFFAGADGDTVTGWGTADAVTRDDHDLGAIRSAIERIDGRTRTLAHPDLPERARRPPAWIGGHSFAAGSRHEAAWAAFPAACFVAPRWTHRSAGGTATLALVLGPDESPDVPRLLDEYATLASGGPCVPPRRPSRPPVLPLSDGDREDWIAAARTALTAIERGMIRKVVLARHLDLTLAREDAIDVVHVLDDLARRFPTCTRFLLARDGAQFFGATPETLVERTGDRVRAEAMAGSCRPGDETTLEASRKDAREHALVVEHVLARLRPFCDPLEAPPAPSLRRFANITHLWTPIRGRLDRPVHVLDLVASLHPTPAVAGTPTPAAVALLERTEAVPRGWFAGPFGWFDATGDGHFVVALRSCVRHALGVRLYAGAGIVRGSDPGGEFAETALKLRALLDTLHAVTDEPADRVG